MFNKWASLASFGSTNDIWPKCEFIKMESYLNFLPSWMGIEWVLNPLLSQCEWALTAVEFAYVVANKVEKLWSQRQKKSKI